MHNLGFSLNLSNTGSASVPRIRSIINEATSSPTMNSREREVRVKQEGDRSQWSSHKNPRIVRVSRSFGGKDRHSKVCTVRGLRDRRIRLSVPTAIQLYDLQDKLGLSQPSKAVDWLLDNTKNDIDKLPPLPIIPGSFTESPPLNHQSNLSQFLTSNQLYPKDVGKEGIKMMNDERGEKDKWIDHQQENNHEGFVAQNLFPLGGNVNQPSFHTMPYNPYSFHWDHPNLSLSHIGGAYHLPNQQEEQSQNTLPSTSQLYFCPNATTIPTIIPSFPSMENVQQNPLFSTALHLTSPMKSFPFNTYSKSVHPRQNDTGRSGKDS